MRLNIKDRTDLQEQIDSYIASGGEIKKEDAALDSNAMRKAMSLASRHLGRHNRMGARV